MRGGWYSSRVLVVIGRGRYGVPEGTGLSVYCTRSVSAGVRICNGTVTVRRKLGAYREICSEKSVISLRSCRCAHKCVFAQYSCCTRKFVFFYKFFGNICTLYIKSVHRGSGSACTQKKTGVHVQPVVRTVHTYV